MAVPIVNEVWTNTFACNTATQAGLNRINYRVTGTTGGGITDQQLANGLDAIAAPLYKAFMAVTSQYYGSKMVRHTPGPIAIPVISALNTGNGVAGAIMIPSEVGYIVKLITLSIGRDGRGRLFLPFIASAMLAATGEPSGAMDANALNLINALAAAPITITVGGATTTVQATVCSSSPTDPGRLVTGVLASGRWGQLHKRGDYGRANLPPPIAP